MAECNDYISQCRLEVNGRDIEDFSSVAISERIFGTTQRLMNKYGYATSPSEHRITVTYIKPSVNPYDWTDIGDGRLTVIYDSGDRITFTGLRLISIGEETIDGDSFVSQPITLFACIRTDE